MTLPYPIDLSTRPASLGPRVSRWALFAFGWGVCFVVLLLGDILLSGPASPALVVAVLAVAGVATVTLVYAETRLVPVQASVAIPLRSPSGSVIDPEDEPRLADPAERAARRRLRRGTIPRQEYERVVAYRHFVHGEISRAEYHEICRFLGVDPETGAVRDPST
jgi:hypothetical protein